MPTIPNYQQRTTTPLQAVQDGIRPVEQTNFIARGLSQVGQGAGDLAAGLHDMDERRRREETENLVRQQQKQEEADRSTWATIEPKIRLEMVRWREQNEGNFPESGEGYSQATLDQIDSLYQPFRDNEQNSPYFRNLIDASWGATRADIGGAAIQREQDYRNNWTAGTVERTLGASVNLLQAAPLDEIDTLYEAERERAYALIDSSGLPPDARANARQNADTMLANAVVRRRAEADPAAFLSGADLSSIGGLQGQIVDAAEGAGLDPGLALVVQFIENPAGDPQARPIRDGRQLSSAHGIFQILDGTWAGLGGGDRDDVGLQISHGVTNLVQERDALQSALGRAPQPWEVYLAHQQGGGAARAILANPGANAIALLTPIYEREFPGRGAEIARQAVVNNGGRDDMTAGDFAGLWQARYQRAEQQVSARHNLAAAADPDVMRAARVDAQQELDRRERERQAEIARQNAARLNLLEIQISRGEAGYDEIQQAVEEGWLDPSDQALVTLTRAADQVAEEQAEAAALQARVAEAGRGGAALDPTDATHRQALDDNFIAQASQWEPEQFGAQAAAYVARFGMVPAPLETQIVTDLRSTDPERRVRAAALYGQIRSSGGPVDEIGSATDRARLGLLLRYSRAGMSPQQAAEALDQVVTLGREEVSQRDAAFRARMQAGAQDRFDQNRFLIGALGQDRRVRDARGFFGGDFAVPEEMRADLETLAMASYRGHGDMQAAFETAYDQLRQTWAPSAFNGRQWMRNAPEAVYGVRTLTAAQNAEWMRAQLLGDLGNLAPPEDEVRLIEAPSSLSPDGSPIYYVMRATDAGMDHIERNGSPIFWRPDYAGSRGASDARRRQQSTVDEARRERERLRADYQRLVRFGDPGPRGEF